MRMSSFLLLVLAFEFVPAPIAAAEIRAGVARVDLTPPLDMQASLGGYGDRMSRPAEGVHDRIMAKALVLADGSRRFALVTADVLGFPPPVKQAVLQELSAKGWTGPQVMLLPSHSHTSIDMMQINPKNKLPIAQLGLFKQAVYELTVSNLVRVIDAASQTLVPVAIGTARTELAGWNANRRRGEETVDRQLTVTRIDRQNGQPLTVLVNWTAHPTFMGSADMLFSGGWPGHLQRTLEALLGAGVTVMYYNGAQGDQRPVARPDSGPSRWERAERYGRELALVAGKLVDQVKTSRDVTFQFASQSIPLPEPVPHADFKLTGGAEYGLTDLVMQRLLATIFPAETASGSLRLGDLLIVGVPGELAAGLGLELKAKARQATGAPCPTIGGLANEWVSYILSRDQYERGGYEASVSFYGPGLGDTIVQGALDGVRALDGR